MMTPAEKQHQDYLEQIRLMSDEQLYREAVNFITEQHPVDGQTQMASLLSYTQSWDDLIGFVRHQSQRDWIGRKTYYKQFYIALESYLKQLSQQVETRFPPDPNASKQAKRAWVDRYTLLVAREFVQHLAAENLYQEKVKK